MLVAITGPTGSGKTTTGQALVQKLDRGVHIDMDTVKHYICTGFIYDETAEGLEQWKLLGENTSALIRNFLDHEYDVIVNGCVHEITWREITKQHDLDHKVLLFPDKQTNINRDMRRPKTIAMGRNAVLSHRDLFNKDTFYKDWLRYDSSGDSPKESVQALQKLLKVQPL